MTQSKCRYCGATIMFDKQGFAPSLCGKCQALPICEGNSMISHVRDLKAARTQLRNCVFKPKAPLTEPMFYAVPGVGFVCNLDGYAIVSVEDYNALLARSKECWWCRLLAWFRK